MFYSYDIFDTCIVRACGYPETVFDILAEKILGPLVDTAWKYDFALERREGERRAREKFCIASCEDVTLEEIYSCCDFSLYTALDSVTIMQRELEIEKDVLLPVYNIKKEIETLHQDKKHVCFISDMYLPYSFLLRILTEFGLFIHGDKLFVSSEVRKTKSTGNLYKYIQALFDIDYHSWMHRGDNLYGDCYIPKKLGIRTKIVANPLSTFEKEMISQKISSIDDIPVRSANISRAIRISNSPNSNISFAADFVAPIYVPFVFNILEDAKKRGVERLYFLARDGYILYMIAEQLTHLFPSISLGYLYVSRKSLYLPALTELSTSSVEKMFWKLEGKTLDEILDVLQMSGYPAKDIIKNNGDARCIIADLLSDDSFVCALKKRQNQQRELCYRYFMQEGITTGNCAIVDLAGTRKCHEAINTILSFFGKGKVFGYYLEVLSNRIKGVDYDALFFLDRFDVNERGKNPLLPQELFEQYFSISPHDRTGSYQCSEGKIIPVFDKDLTDDVWKLEIFNINITICSQYLNYYLLFMGKDHSKQCFNAINVYKKFYNIPEQHYIKAIENVVFWDSSYTPVKLLEKKSIINVIRNRKKMVWFPGNLVYNTSYPLLMTKILNLARHFSFNDLGMQQIIFLSSFLFLEKAVAIFQYKAKKLKKLVAVLK